MRTILITIAVIAIAGCSGKSQMETEAERAVAAQAEGKITTTLVGGERENAVCGRVGDKRFVYRTTLLVIEGQSPEWSAVQFEALHRAWCEQ